MWAVVKEVVPLAQFFLWRRPLADMSQLAGPCLEKYAGAQVFRCLIGLQLGLQCFAWVLATGWVQGAS